jgi:anti-sigma regulatory factor (Ser/Thr protein kinase)
MTQSAIHASLLDVLRAVRASHLKQRFLRGRASRILFLLLYETVHNGYDVRRAAARPPRGHRPSPTMSRGCAMEWYFQSADAAEALSERRSFSEYVRARCTPESDCDAAEIVFGELVANVVQHAPGPIEITVESNLRGALILDVRDWGHGFAHIVATQPSTESEVGRGLYLVSHLCDHVAWARTPAGTRVSALLPCYTKRTPKAATSS